MINLQLNQEHQLIEYNDCKECCDELDLQYSCKFATIYWSYLNTPVVRYSWQHEIPFGYISNDKLIPIYSIDELSKFIEQRKIVINKAQEQTVNESLLDQIEQL